MKKIIVLPLAVIAFVAGLFFIANGLYFFFYCLLVVFLANYLLKQKSAVETPHGV